MKITFLGTRGYIKASSRRHRRHTSTLITYNNKKILIDCGLDWVHKIWSINPDAIVITHAHPDHAWGLKFGSPCPVYATTQSWELMNNYPIDAENRHVMIPRKKVKIHNVTFETFPVVHSIRAPGVGYRITADNKSIFVVHDLISINDRKAALQHCQLYVGDGATIVRPLVRRKDHQLFGHTTIRAQLGWCQKEGVKRAIITHCGSQIVEADGRTVRAKVDALGKERKVNVSIAYDGMVVKL